MDYRTGAHAPLGREDDAVGLRIDGVLPQGLHGVFVRNGPDPAFEPPGRYHWFDGDGMVHALFLGPEGASTRCRRVQTAALRREREAGRALWGGILHPVAPPDGPPIKDTANTHLLAWRNRLLATWWLSGKPMELDPVTLQTLGAPPFVEALMALPGARRTVAAHPKTDPTTGELAFMGFQLHKPPYFWVGIADADGELLRVADIDVLGPQIPHDIGLTKQFVVLLDLPLGWDAAQLRAGKPRIGFDKDRGARIGLWRRDGTAPVQWFEVPPCYVYHLTSSYESGDDVVITGCRVDDPIPEQPDETGRVPRLDNIHLVPVTTRWTLHRTSGTATVQTIDDTPTEFPRVDDRLWGQPVRFAYHPRLAQAPVLQFDGFHRLDHETGSTVACRYPKGWFGGEVVFAPRAGGTAEDDGFVVTILTNENEPGSVAWVLDAKAVDAGPVAMVHLPWRIPLGFHAEWRAT